MIIVEVVVDFVEVVVVKMLWKCLDRVGAFESPLEGVVNARDEAQVDSPLTWLHIVYSCQVILEDPPLQTHPSVLLVMRWRVAEEVVVVCGGVCCLTCKLSTCLTTLSTDAISALLTILCN